MPQIWNAQMHWPRYVKICISYDRHYSTNHFKPTAFCARSLIIQGILRFLILLYKCCTKNKAEWYADNGICCMHVLYCRRCMQWSLISNHPCFSIDFNLKASHFMNLIIRRHIYLAPISKYTYMTTNVLPLQCNGIAILTRFLYKFTYECVL